MSNLVDVYGNDSIAGKLNITQSAANNSVSVTGDLGTDLIGALTITQGAGYNYIDIADSSIGATTINQGTSDVGYNELDIGSDISNSSSSTSFSGTVTVNQGDGVDNVYVATVETVDFIHAATFTANTSAYAEAVDGTYAEGMRTYHYYATT